MQKVKVIAGGENQAAKSEWGSKGRLPRARGVLMTPYKMAKMWGGAKGEGRPRLS